MYDIEQTLTEWKQSLMSSIPLARLLSRNATAYKWKAPFRSWMLREAVFWRVHDLLTQSYLLHNKEHALGARILLRSAFESLATLIHLNQLTQKVLEQKLDFHQFSDKTATLLLGSRNNQTETKALNIITILEKCDKRYPRLKDLYAELSECAHPNYEGLCTGYSTVDHSECETNFTNRCTEIYGQQHLTLMELCMETFHYEYSEIWTDLIEQLEIWIQDNDIKLEATKKETLT